MATAVNSNVMHLRTRQYTYGAIAVGTATFLCLLITEVTQSLYVSVVLVLPLFLLEHIWSPNSLFSSFIFSGVFPVALYLLWALQLARGVPDVPQRSVALFLVFLSLAIVYAFLSWDYGVKWQGPHFTLVAVGISFLGAAAVVALLIYACKRRSLASSSAYHAGLFIWITCLAFPWLGEMP